MNVKYIFFFLLSWITAAVVHSVQAQSISINNIGEAPHTSSILDLSKGGGGLLIPRMSFTERMEISDPPAGLWVYQTNVLFGIPSGFYYFDGNEWLNIAKDSDAPDLLWQKNLENQHSLINGRIGIGINSPAQKLHIRTVTDSDGLLLEGINPILQMRQYNQGTGEYDNKGYIHVSGSDIRIGTNVGNTVGKTIIRTDGTNKFSFSSSGIMQVFNTAGSQTGSISPNTAGGFRISASAVLNLDDEIFINGTGNVNGIGTSSPTEKLDVNGNLRIREDLLIEDKLVKPETGSGRNLLPVFYGTVSTEGVLLNGTSNVTIQVEEYSAGRFSYVVGCPGISSTAIVVVTSRAPNGLWPHMFPPENGSFKVSFTGSSSGNAGTKTSFSFIVYQN